MNDSPVYLGDAFDVLPTLDLLGWGIVTSLPDADEIGLGFSAWTVWFRSALRLCLAYGNPVVFYQTDRRSRGVLHSKAYLVLEAAVSAGADVLWHKIVLRRSLGLVELRRPGFAHLIAVGRGVGPGRATPDVLDVGRTLYANGMSIPATEVAVDFVGERAEGILDPFCGYGTVLRVAEARGYPAVGVDIDPAQVERARTVSAALT